MTKNQKPEKDASTLAIENNPCQRCGGKHPTWSCKGAGADDEKKEDKKKVANHKSNSTFSSASSQAAIITILEKAKTIGVLLFSHRIIKHLKNENSLPIQNPEDEENKETFQPTETELLSIESDELRGNLIFRVKLGLSSEEIEIAQCFLKMIKAEFDLFKNQLAEQVISTKNFTAILKDNELVIHIPNPKDYSKYSVAFIKHLENKNLLLSQNPEDEENKETLRLTNESHKENEDLEKADSISISPKTLPNLSLNENDENKELPFNFLQGYFRFFQLEGQTNNYQSTKEVPQIIDEDIECTNFGISGS